MSTVDREGGFAATGAPLEDTVHDTGYDDHSNDHSNDHSDGHSDDEDRYRKTG